MLSDEQIAAICAVTDCSDDHCGHIDEIQFARAIESAACADRDARIAELEQRNRDLYEDVQRFKEYALNEKVARLWLEASLYR